MAEPVEASSPRFRRLQLHFVYSTLVEPFEPSAVNLESLAAADLRAHLGGIEIPVDQPIDLEPSSYPPPDGGSGTVRDYLEPYLHLPMPQLGRSLYGIPDGVLRVTTAPSASSTAPRTYDETVS